MGGVKAGIGLGLGLGLGLVILKDSEVIGRSHLSY